MKEHICGLRSHIDVNEFDSSVGPRTITCKDTWVHIFRINGNTPRTKMFVHSMAAVFAERKRHVALNLWWIIHPFSSFRFVWDMIMTIIYMISFLTIPYSVSFLVMSHNKLEEDKFNFLIYTFCWLDILCNCITGYYNQKERLVELRPPQILKNYLKTFLLLDIVSSLPWDHITLPWRRLPGHDSNYLIVLINLLPCFKLLRYPYIDVQIYELFTHFRALYFHYEMFSTFMLGFLIVYWSSCLCYLIPVLFLHFNNALPEECPEYWITGLDSDSPTYKFRYAIFIVVEHLTASGYGTFIPQSDGHLALSSCLMVIGSVLECYIAGNTPPTYFLPNFFLQSSFMYIFVWRKLIKAGRTASESKFQEIVNQLLAYTRQKQLPTHMKIRLQVYYYYRFRGSYFREKLILANLSEQLRQEVALQSSHRLVENVAIFKSLPKTILRAIVMSLKFELYLPSDVIIKAGVQGDCMFFLSAGTVAVLTPTGKEICHLDDGAHFGEVALLVPDQRRVASVMAIEVCEVYRLDRKDFRKCIAVHTELFAKIERIAAERIERAIVIEEQHKRYLMRRSTQIDRKMPKKY